MIEHDASGSQEANTGNLRGRLDKWVSVAYTGIVMIGNCNTFGECTMKKFAFSVDIVADELDRDSVIESLRSCLSDSLPGDIHASVKAGEVKAFSEQGYKVWRARVTGVTAKQAGDAHNSKVEAEAEAVA
jgi:hypothetical protein